MRLLFETRVFGLPVQVGSKNARSINGKVVIYDQTGKRGKTWRSDIKEAVRDAFDATPHQGPVVVKMLFYMPRPKYHYGTGKNKDRLKPSAPNFHDKMPDLDKLERNVNDALSKIAILDDCSISSVFKMKIYGERPGMMLKVYALEPDDFCELIGEFTF
jgi:Holliday junction resolvase RusA-like endonuclease